MRRAPRCTSAVGACLREPATAVRPTRADAGAVLMLVERVDGVNVVGRRARPRRLARATSAVGACLCERASGGTTDEPGLLLLLQTNRVDGVKVLPVRARPRRCFGAHLRHRRGAF